MSRKLDRFTAAYIECALWSSTDASDEYGGETLDANYGIDDIAPACLKEMIEDCRAFQEACADDLDAAGQDDAQSGHDFWLTRNGHGAGFWDRGLGEVGERLSRACKAWGSVDLYVGDDGLIYC